MSAHKLKVETGRYAINRNSRVNVACEECTDIGAAEYLNELPFYSPIIEDENHVLRACPKYHDIRSKLGDTLKANLFADMFSAFLDTRRIAKFIRKIMNRRFPQEDQHKSKKEKKKEERSTGKGESDD